MSIREQQILNATLVRRVELTPDLVQFFIRPDRVPEKFLPGQYVALGLMGAAPRPAHFPAEEQVPAPDKLIKRAYSIGSSADAPAELEFYLAILPNGILTSRLALLAEGDRIHMASKIAGTFTLSEVPADHNLVLVATGTGVAPFMSMLRTSSTWTSGRRITLVHGVRYVSDLAYREELEALQRSRRGEFSYFNIVSRADESWRGRRGYVQRFFEEGQIVLEAQHDHVFLCGNPAMIDQMEVWLLARGFSEHTRKHPGNLHLERYW